MTAPHEFDGSEAQAIAWDWADKPCPFCAGTKLDRGPRLGYKVYAVFPHPAAFSLGRMAALECSGCGKSWYRTFESVEAIRAIVEKHQADWLGPVLSK